MVIVLELHKWQQFIPVILLLIDEEFEVLLQLLIDPFYLAVSFQVVSCSHRKLDSEEPVQLPGQVCYELGSPVRDNLPRKPMQLPHMCHVQPGHPKGRDCSGGQNEVCLFAH